MDLEVDNNGDGNGGTPTGDAQWNVTVEGNTFTDDSGLSVTSIQGQCIPQKNLVIEDDVLDTSSDGLTIVLGGSESSSCVQDTGLTIENNTSLGGASSPCGGSIAAPPACSMIEVADYKNVTISGNFFTANDGAPASTTTTTRSSCPASPSTGSPMRAWRTTSATTPGTSGTAATRSFPPRLRQLCHQRLRQYLLVDHARERSHEPCEERTPPAVRSHVHPSLALTSRSRP